MKKETIADSIWEEVISLIPPRKISKIKLGSSPTGMVLESTSYGEENKELCTEVVESTNYYFKNENAEPRFCYILHEKKDGLLSSRTLFNKLSQKQNFESVVLNPDINEKYASSYIKKSSLKREAIDAGYAQIIPMPIGKTIGTVVAGLLSSLGLIAGFLEFLSFFDGNGMLGGLFSSLSVVSYILALLSFFVLVALVWSFFTQRRNNEKTLLADINEKINSLNDDAFLRFLERFEEEDLYIQNYDTLNNIPLFICSLQNYNFRQRHILKTLWATRTNKQMWWIFSENTSANKAFILNPSPKYELKFYQLKELTTKEKKKLALQTYGDQINFRPADDAGIKIHGADYICRFKIKTLDPTIDTKVLNEKIYEFCQQYTPNYQADIKLIIRLIAELSCNYSIDFSNRRNWEYLFDANYNALELNDLDRTITSSLNLDNRTFINLIPEINHIFSDFFEEILAGYANTEQTSPYKQWCLIKALKCREKFNTDRFTAIADTLMSEFSSAKIYPEDLHTSTWVSIILKTLEAFYSAQCFWFLPTIINNLIHIYQDIPKALETKIYSDPVVLKIAKANLLLNLSAESDPNEPNNIDLIRDHYIVSTRAVQEQNKNYNLDTTSGFPSGLELLQFSKLERQRYYNALSYLKEQDVINYYNYLFDIYCASLLISDDTMKFCYKDLHKNTLYDRYVKGNDIQNPTPKQYIQIILGNLIDLLNNIYGSHLPAIGLGVQKLKNFLNNNASDKTLDNIYFLLAQFDIIEAETLNFIACLIARLKETDGLSKEVYLNLGNYLIALIFLTYYENLEPTFYNDDFIYLVHICTNYTEPSSAILGYLYYCDTRFKPRHSRAIISEFLKEHKNQFMSDLQEIANSITSNNVESFLKFIFCLSLEKQDKIIIYQILRDAILANYADSPKKAGLIELLTLSIDHCSSAEFLSDTAENNIKKLDVVSDSTLFLIYNCHLAIYGYESEYFELCPLIVERIMETTFTSRYFYILEYCLFSKNKETEPYIKTVEYFYEILQESDYDLDITTLERILTFIDIIINHKKDTPHSYEWLEAENALLLKKQVRLKHEQQLLIQSKEFFTHRSWSKYGMVSYLRYLMTNTRLMKSYCPDEYAELGDKEKLDYIISNFKNLQPFIKYNNVLFYNRIYIHMLNYFNENRDDIQNKLNERECQQKFANDSMEVVEKLPYVYDSVKAEIHRMIRDYASLIDRI